MRGFRDRDFLRTREGFLFCVVGPFHPPDRAVSYLKYVPAKLGLWGRGKKRFRRVMRAYTIPSLLETFRLLERSSPHYLFYSSFYNITMTAVPHEYIAKHYKPEEKLAQLLQAARLDSLQKKLLRFASFLSDKGGISPNSLGATGSILLNIHRPEFSDIDMTVYGLKNSLAAKSALTKAYSLSSSPARRLEGDALKAWCTSKARHHPLTFDEAMQIYQRKWNIGIFEGTAFSIHPIKLEEEVTEAYGEKTYHPVAPITIRAVVHDNANCMFLPAVYQVQEVKTIEGPPVTDIQEVVSYEGLYSDIAEAGETILARGKLERVLTKRPAKNTIEFWWAHPKEKAANTLKYPRSCFSLIKTLLKVIT